ncbi:hypothetical protein NY547_00545 [Cnuibacter physcomitrellae]|uniref:putative Ig domain-containing protein n=1 Tax=Cnuibacter physcomitrellae TaxID=1619308 RepID=UPI0021757A54|nr:putative Ig domain-containing protein [Cnuibacter physcomitrellae]MCS5495725.1 hypothetical protein [Cnuibacter physcomitrellae]
MSTHSRRRHLTSTLVAALAATLVALPALPASASPTPPTQKDFLPAGAMPWWQDALVDASGNLVTYSENYSPAGWELTLAITTSAGVKTRQSPLAFRPSSMVPAPGDGVLLLDSKKKDGVWASEVFLLDTSGSGASTVPVPADTVRIATDGTGAIATVGADGSVQVGTVGSGAFRTIGKVTGDVTDVVLRSDGTVYTCGTYLHRVAGGTATAMPGETGYCRGIEDDDAHNGAVALWTSGRYVSYRGDGSSVGYGYLLDDWWNTSIRFGVLSDGDLVVAPDLGKVLYRYDLTTGRAYGVGTASRKVPVTNGSKDSKTYRPVFAVGADDSVYVSEDSDDGLTGAVDRFNMDDALTPTFEGYPAIIGATLWNTVGPVYPEWSGEVAPSQFIVVSGKLPPSMKVNPSTGRIEGYPSERGLFTATIAMTRPGGSPITTTVTIDVESRKSRY